MRTIFILATLLLGVTSENVSGKDNTRKLVGTCPTDAVVGSSNPTDGTWNFFLVQGTAPYHFADAIIEYKGNAINGAASVICRYRDSTGKMYPVLTAFQGTVWPHSCSFIANEPDAKKCPYQDPSKCSIYCFHNSHNM